MSYFEEDDMELTRIEKKEKKKPSMPSTLSTTISQEVWSSGESVSHFRSLQEHYEVTTNQDNLTLFSLFVCCEPMGLDQIKFIILFLLNSTVQMVGVDPQQVQNFS